MRFDAFVILAGMRTGSNFLQASLNALPGLTCHGELFNPHFIGAQGRTTFLGIPLAERDRNPLALFDRVVEAGPGLPGFRFFHDHDRRVLDRLLPDPRIAKVILTRNPLDSYLSWKIAQATGQWKLTDPEALRSARATFDAAEFDGWLQDRAGFLSHLRRALQATGQTAFHISYGELADVAVLNGLARFLGADGTLAAPDATLLRQNPGHACDKVTNPAEMAAALSRLDPFALDQPAESEPRRGAAVPTLVAAAGAPILFLPVRGGPEAEVTGWMAGLGRGGLRSGMTHRDLRQWKRANPGFRSFTVLSHPVARAHSAFVTQVLEGGLPDLRARVVRAAGVTLPPAEAGGASLPAGTHRAAFLAFLTFVGRALSGQGGLRVPAGWASQTAVLQGFATLRPPDVILREEALVAGLARLARDAGVPSPPPVAAGPPHGLAPPDGTEIEAAVRDIYARDFLEFGFGQWRGLRADGQAA